MRRNELLVGLKVSGIVERDGQELRPDGGCGVVEDAVDQHLARLDKSVRSVVCLFGGT